MNKLSCTFYLLLCTTLMSYAQISLVKDINPTGGSAPNAGFVYNDAFYFSADDGVHGDELWKSDGTEIGTTLVMDLVEGEESGSPAHFTEFQDQLYFLALGEDIIGETLLGELISINLWRTTGTRGSTTLREETDGNKQISIFHSPFSYGNSLYFRASTSNGSQIWKDGLRPNESTRISNFLPGTLEPGLLGNPILTGNTLFLIVDSGNGAEPHVFDGFDGFTELKDINPDGPGSAPDLIFGHNGYAFFNAYNGELYRPFVSNGRDIGTKEILTDINVTSDVGAQNFVNLGNDIYFTANIDSTQITLWKTSGPAGTEEEVHRFPLLFGLFTNIVNMYATETEIYISSNTEDHANGLWKYDGTDMTLLSTMGVQNNVLGSPRYFVEIDDLVYFSAADDTEDRRLWVTDGTPEGTRTVASLHEDSLNPSSVRHLYNVNGTLLFTGELVEDDEELFALNVISSGVNDDLQLQASDLFSIYPNPSTQGIHVSTSLSGPISYEIIDLNGRALQVGTVNQFIDHSLDSGVYILRLTDQKIVFHDMIIVE